MIIDTLKTLGRNLKCEVRVFRLVLGDARPPTLPKIFRISYRVFGPSLRFYPGLSLPHWPPGRYDPRTSARVSRPEPDPSV